jgi:hypothetical protein
LSDWSQNTQTNIQQIKMITLKVVIIKTSDTSGTPSCFRHPAELLTLKNKAVPLHAMKALLGKEV